MMTTALARSTSGGEHPGAGKTGAKLKPKGPAGMMASFLARGAGGKKKVQAGSLSRFFKPAATTAKPTAKRTTSTAAKPVSTGGTACGVGGGG